MAKRIFFAICMSLLTGLVLSQVDVGNAEENIKWVEVARWELTENYEWIAEGLKLLGGEDSNDAELQAIAAAGLWEYVKKGDRPAVQTRPAGYIEYMYLYFVLDDDILYDQPAHGDDLLFTVEYFAEGMTTWTVNYDSWDMDWNLYFPRIQNVFEDEWKTAYFHVQNARLYNRQHDVADFRLATDPNQKISICKVTISLPPDSPYLKK